MPRPNVNTAPSAFSARQARCHASAKIAAFSTANHENSSKRIAGLARHEERREEAAGDRERGQRLRIGAPRERHRQRRDRGQRDGRRQRRQHVEQPRRANVVRYRMPAPAPSSETP
jgi:hypothetical protein